MGALARVAALLLVLACACDVCAASERYTLAGGQVMEVEVYPGVSRWKLVPNLWMHKTVNVTCPGTAVRCLGRVHAAKAATSPVRIVLLRLTAEQSCHR